MDEQAKKGFIVNIVFISIWVTLIVVAGRLLLQYLLPFLIAVAVAALMQKPAEKISQKTRIKKGTAAAVLSAVLYIAAAALFVFLALKTIDAAGEALSNISSIGERALGFIEKTQKITSRIFRDLSPEIQEATKKILTGMITGISEKISAWLSNAAAAAVRTAPSFLFSSLVALAASCYIAKDFDGLSGFLKGLISPEKAENLSKVRKILKTSVLKILAGYGILMLLTFAELAVGLLLLGIKNALLTAFAIAVIDILPVLGAGSVLLPWSIICVISGNTALGAGLIAVYLFVTVVRNFAEPKIVGEKTGVNPLFILLAMFLGLRLFGFLGLIILPVTLIVVIKYYKNEMEQETS